MAEQDFRAVAIEKLVGFAQRAYEGCGVPSDQARDAAVAIVDADLHGTSTHGLKNLRMYITNLREGRTNPTPNIREVGGGKAARVLDADNSLGHVAGWAGMRRAIELAREYGIGNCFVRSSNHYGHSAFWSRMALKHNMIGFAFTTAGPTMAAWGGKVPIVGNNPPSWSVPTMVVDEANPLPYGAYEPMFLDMALSVVAGNKLDIYRRRGDDVPNQWALDSEGKPTQSALATREGGSLTPIAEYKGSGLSILLAAINNFLAGAPFDDMRRDPGGRFVNGTTTHWFTAYDIGQFRDPEEFASDVRGIRDRVRATPPKEGVKQVFAPGDLENDRAKRWLNEGVPLESFVFEDLAWVAEHTGVEYDLG
jgi:LDH2 family malate/lactate/ureidoglycolate dehydrogenase